MVLRCFDILTYMSARIKQLVLYIPLETFTFDNLLTFKLHSLKRFAQNEPISNNVIIVELSYWSRYS